jgi:DnaJ-class molecular chaperone
MPRTTVGEVGDLLRIPMYIAAAWTTCAVNDLCSLDTTANMTVKDSVNHEQQFGKIVELPDVGATKLATLIAAGDVVATVEVHLRFKAIRAFEVTGSVPVGDSIQTAGAGYNTFETVTYAFGYPMVIYNPGAAGICYALV